MASIVFITGSDTGVGKTVLTALLVRFLRRQQFDALAMKPFCSGPPDDVDILWHAQERAISRDQINPYHYRQPVAPLIAARASGKIIPEGAVVEKIHTLAERCEVLLVEGAGGLFVPLGEGYTVAHIIQRLCCPVILVARNQLGAVNHTLLTLHALQALGQRCAQVVLMDPPRRDITAMSNPGLIHEFSGADVTRVPNLGPLPVGAEGLDAAVNKSKKTLAKILAADIFSPAFGKPGRKK